MLNKALHYAFILSGLALTSLGINRVYADNVAATPLLELKYWPLPEL